MCSRVSVEPCLALWAYAMMFADLMSDKRAGIGIVDSRVMKS